MAEHHAHPRHEDDGPMPDPMAVGHETSDAQSGPIIRFLIFLGAFSVAIALLMVVFHNYLERREAAEKVSRYPVAAGRERALPPPPRLQSSPFQDIKQLRAAERHVLEQYEWINQKDGLVRIPVSRAMELIAERGLPYRTSPPAAETGAEAAQEPAGNATGAGAEKPSGKGRQ
jgi:hypothetical protein